MRISPSFFCCLAMKVSPYWDAQRRGIPYGAGMSQQQPFSVCHLYIGPTYVWLLTEGRSTTLQPSITCDTPEALCLFILPQILRQAQGKSDFLPISRIANKRLTNPMPSLKPDRGRWQYTIRHTRSAISHLV